MKAETEITSTRQRRLFVRIGLVVVYAAVMAFTFVAGKGHTLLLDNKNVEENSLTAFEDVTVSVDGHEGTELMAGDRDMAKLVGQRHRILVEVANGQKVEKMVKLPLGTETLILSVPKFVAGVEPSIVTFVAADQPQVEAPTGDSNSFTSPGGTPEVIETPGSGAGAAATPAP